MINNLIAYLSASYIRDVTVMKDTQYPTHILAELRIYFVISLEKVTGILRTHFIVEEKIAEWNHLIRRAIGTQYYVSMA